MRHPKRNYLRLFPVLILVVVACNFSSTGTAPVKTPTATIVPSVPPPTTTNVPIPGDLGFGNVTGEVTDAATSLPIPNVTVTCEHFSYTSNEADRCNRTTITDQDGVFLFEKVFFHDTDTIQLTIEAAGYETTKIKQSFFTWNIWDVDIALKRVP